MTTWWITIELAKEYFSTLKDIQLFSTGSHCCAQLGSFWLRAMDSPWEPNCTQHDSTDRYAIGSAEVIRPVHRVVFRVGQWCTQRQATTGKANGHNVVLMRVLTAILKYPCSVHVAHNGYCCSAMQSLSLQNNECRYTSLQSPIELRTIGSLRYVTLVKESLRIHKDSEVLINDPTTQHCYLSYSFRLPVVRQLD